jgi:hypothetical protein
MNRQKRKSSNNKKAIMNNKIIRCRSKMIPVFERDNCDRFLKKRKY